MACFSARRAARSSVSSLARGLVGDAHDVGAVHEAIGEGERGGSVGEDAVGSDQVAVALEAAADEFEQKVGVAIA